MINFGDDLGRCRIPPDWPVEWGPPPSWATRRTPERQTFGAGVAKAAELLGTPLWPWQRYVCDVALEVEQDGTWAYDEIVVTTPRQSGKTTMLGPIVLQRLIVGARRQVWMTAQKGKAADRWRQVAEAIVSSNVVRPSVRYTYGHANERLEVVRSGSIFKPFTGVQHLHGESPDLVLVDEVWSFTAAQQAELEESYRPAWSVKDGQAWLLSTAGTQKSEWLNAVRRRGRQAVEDDRRHGVAFFEWSAPEQVGGTPLMMLGDEQLVETVVGAHPRRDHGLRTDALVTELERRPRARWLRDFANITVVEEDEMTLFPENAMATARSGEQIPGDARIALSVAADPDRRDAAVGVAWRTPAGVALTSEHHGPGTRWTAGAIIGLVDQWDVACVAVRNAGPARSIADELDRAGVPLLRVSQQDWAAACTQFGDEFTADRPSITWDGSLAFSAAVAAAEAKRVQSGQVWVSRDGGSITALEARTLAVWSIDHAPVPEPRVSPQIW